MVQLAFTFLLGIHNESPTQRTGEGKRKNGDRQVKEKVDEQEEEEEEEDGKYEEIEVTKAEFCGHIEYSLEPEKASKSVDVVCWEQAAKIYFENSSSAIAPFQTKNLTWIYFRIGHIMKWSLDEVSQIRSHKITFNIFLEYNKLGDAAKSDKPNKFYGFKTSQSQSRDSTEKPLFRKLKEKIEDLDSNHSSFRSLRDIPSLSTNFESETHSKKLTNILRTLSNEYQNEKESKEPIYLGEVAPPLVDILQIDPVKESISVKREKTKAKSEKQLEEKTKNKIEFCISGEEVLSGQKLLEKVVKHNSEKIPYVVCLCEPRNVLGLDQARILKPLCITINKLEDLPTEYLKSKGIQHVQLRFLVCDTFLSESYPIPVNNRIRLSHARCVFTNGIDHRRLIQFLQTDGLTVELFGISKKNSNQREGGASTVKLRKRDTEQPEQQLVYIGTIFTDISFILVQPHRIRLTCSVQTTRKIDEASRSKTERLTTNTNEVNCKEETRNKKEGALLLRGGNWMSTTVTVTIALAYPITSVLKKVAADIKLFNRLVLILRKPEFAIPVITMINNTTKNGILGAVDHTKMGTNLKRPLSKYHGLGTIGRRAEEARITGFCVDCVDFVIVYAESSVAGDLQHLWALASSLSPENARVLYDSSLVFSCRFYESLMPLGGFLATALKEPLNAIMAKSKSYSSQNICSSVRTALSKLHLLSKTTSIKSAVQSQLFPATNSLLSLALEFGSPIHYSHKT